MLSHAPMRLASGVRVGKRAVRVCGKHQRFEYVRPAAQLNIASKQHCQFTSRFPHNRLEVIFRFSHEGRAWVLHVMTKRGKHERQALRVRQGDCAADQRDEAVRRVRDIHAVEEVVVRVLPVRLAHLRAKA